ncbi:MAG TPA: LuxR C-terminal-related transcriptional regulator [Candidatus Saccharimonadales bacterium]|nr:LuxR C-terminal-related transcriptional regulator [Candidatus Saccharimonadales bacterium]
MEHFYDAREVELLQLFANGMIYATIALDWEVSERQVRRIAEVLFSKLNAHNPQHAVGMGFKRGLLTRSDVMEEEPLANLKVTRWS